MIRPRPFPGMLAGLALLAIALVVPVAPRNLDEAVYTLMAQAAASGRLTVENGYEEYPSDALRISFLRTGREGLVPQYPSGYAFLAAPFHALGGLRGLVILNTLGFLLSMALTYGLARQVDSSPSVAWWSVVILAFGTFFLPYAYGIWPHALAVAAVTGSLLSIVAASREDRSARRGAGLSLAAGLIAGLGVSIRVDCILLVPPVLLWMGADRRLWGRASLFIVGLAPGLALASALNYLKFGSPLPVDYGTEGGDTALGSYMPLVVLALAAAAAAVAVSSSRFNRLVTLRNFAVLAATALISSLAFAPVRGLLGELATGFYVLVIDFQRYTPSGSEVQLFTLSDSGHLLLIGQLKRALLQSLPWLGVLPLAALRWKRQGPLLGLFGLFLVCWIAPFALRHWHGGGAPHMRYFLPLLPLLAVLGAGALAEARRLAEGGRRFLAWPAVGAVLLTPVIVAGVISLNGFALSAASGGALLLAAGTAGAALASAWGVRKAALPSAALMLAGLIWSGVWSLLYDFATDRAFRAAHHGVIEASEELGDHVLVITGLAFQFLPQLERPGSYVANVDPGSGGRADFGLIDHHLEAGRQVFVDGLIADAIFVGPGTGGYAIRQIPFANRTLLELRPRSTPTVAP